MRLRAHFRRTGLSFISYFVVYSISMKFFFEEGKKKREESARMLFVYNVNKYSVSKFIHPTTVFSINNFGRVSKKGQGLPLHIYIYIYIRPCLDAKHYCFQLRFYSNNYFTSGGELIRHLIPNLKDQYASFSLVLHLWPIRQERPYQ